MTPGFSVDDFGNGLEGDAEFPAKSGQACTSHPARPDFQDQVVVKFCTAVFRACRDCAVGNLVALVFGARLPGQVRVMRISGIAIAVSHLVSISGWRTEECHSDEAMSFECLVLAIDGDLEARVSGVMPAEG